MDVEQVLVFVDSLVLTNKGKYLSDLQRLLLHAYWSDPRLRYDDIAKIHGYSINYLKQDVGPKLWQILSEVCGEKVSKTNFRSALERKFIQENSILSRAENSSPVIAKEQLRETSGKTNLAVSSISNSIAVGKTQQYQDWGDAPDVSVFYNRTQEIDILEKWIVDDNCRLVVLSGMGGIGKTHLSIKLAEQIQHHFEHLIWRSLVPAKPLSKLILELLEILTHGEEKSLPIGMDEQISTLIHILKKKRCLLILDNIESILSSGVFAGQYQEDYGEYRTFFQRLGERNHNSCLLLTTREKPQEITLMQGETLPVRSLKLEGLSLQAGQKIFNPKDVF